MNWLKKIFGFDKPKTVQQPVVQSELVLENVSKEELAKVEAPQVKNYPRSEYKVYWELMPVFNKGSWSAELRFIQYVDSKTVNVLKFESPSLETVKKLAWRALPIQMTKYKH